MSSNSTALSDLSRVGIGYGIAIAVGILVLITTIMLASYVCVRVHGQTQARAAAAATAALPMPPFTGAAVDVEAGGGTGGGGGGGGGGGTVHIPGLDQATLDTYPRLRYGELKRRKGEAAAAGAAGGGGGGGGGCCCSICLAEYKDADVVRVLPDCGHVFHVACIDAWMRMQATCPMCRSSPLASPLSALATPLTELLPLARHSARIHR